MPGHNSPWVCVALTLVLIELVLPSGSWSHDHILWTPIYVDATNRLDLWTISSTGCKCPDGKSTGCACCVQGGCLCASNQNKCAQCGLEDVCQRFCNVSISSRTIAIRSGLSWVQIKSPEMEGTASCWWKLHSAAGQRIEVQIHRLVSVGYYNNNTLTCSGGVLQFADGEIRSPTRQAIQMCAQNSRFSPPVVFFGDQGTATLLMRTESKTTRAMLLAYVSFSSGDDPLVGFVRKGGRLRAHSACDWIYDNCFDQDCVLVSPGYPGLFPPHRKCRYILNANVTTDKIRIHFTSISFPPPQLCSSHHIAIWKRNVSNLQNLGTPWKTLCQESESRIEIDGGFGLIEFRSGATISPYLYTGFRAVVQYIHTGALVPTQETQTPLIAKTDGQVLSSSSSSSGGAKRYRNKPHRTVAPPIIRNYDEEDEDEEEEEDEYEEGVRMNFPQAPYDANTVHQISCGHVFDGTSTRGSVFRLLIPKDLAPRHPGFTHHQHHAGFSKFGIVKCQLEFRGKTTDVVQLAVFNYRLRGSSCASYLEVYDLMLDGEQVGGGAEGESSTSLANITDHNNSRLLGKLCGPIGNEVKRYTSSHRKMSLITMLVPYVESAMPEYLDGAFRFHDESIEGTVKPMSSCEVVYYGVTSPPSGTIVGPPDSPLLRLSTYPLVCAYSFLPGGNQTISLTLTRAGQETSSATIPGTKTYCRSYCGTSGCQCEAKYAALKDIDHLLIVAGTTPISCLCGYFPDALPMTFESQSALTLVYHATHVDSEFSYATSFLFKRKMVCSNFSIAPPSGSKRWREALGPAVVTSFFQSSREFQQYTYFQCSWIVSIPQRYNLSIDFISEENEKDCNAWNLTLWAGSEQRTKDDYRNVIGSFCPRQGRQEVKVPEDMVEAHIRLVGVSLRPPQFEIRWKYTDVLLQGLTESKVSSGGGGRESSLRSGSVQIALFVTFLLLHVLGWKK